MRKKNWGRKLSGVFLAGFGVVIALLMISGTSAYMTDHREIINRITAGCNETGTEEEFPEPEPVIPGESVIKKVRVRNRGSVECYVRVSVLVSEGTVVLEGLDMKNWVQENGFYYYRSTLKPGENTTYLFTGIKTDKTADGESVTVTVAEESIQACHAGNFYRDYREAWDHYRGGEMV